MEAVFEKVKTHTESLNTFTNTISTLKHQTVDTNKTLNYPTKAVDKTKNSNVDTNTKNAGKLTNVINKTLISKGRPYLRLHQKRNQSPNITELSNERDNPTDLIEKKQKNYITRWELHIERNQNQRTQTKYYCDILSRGDN